MDDIGDEEGCPTCRTRPGVEAELRIGLDDGVEEVEVVGVVHDVWDYSCDKAVFDPQNQIEQYRRSGSLRHPRSTGAAGKYINKNWAGWARKGRTYKVM